MKIAMLGAGATGSVFASYLRLGGAEVYLVDPYRAHMEAVAARGMLFHTPEGDRVVDGFHTSVSAEVLGVMDAVIVLTKCNYTEAALSAARGMRFIPGKIQGRPVNTVVLIQFNFSLR